MVIKDMLLSLGAAHGRTGQAMIPKGIVVHYVGNPGSSAAANRNWFENGSSGAGVSSHYIIGLGGEIIRCIPDNEKAQHAGKSYGKQWDELAKTNNSKFIGIECCHPDASGKFNDKTTQSLIGLVAELCGKHKLNVSKDVYRHYDVTGKICPMYYVRNPEEWDRLKTLFINEGGDIFDMLYKENIINDPAYWKKNAVVGGVCDGAYVRLLAERVVRRLGK